jgi:arylsulfatase A-like enzyme
LEMNRREFVQSGIAASLLTGIENDAAAKTPAKQKPNVLYVFDDEHRFQSMPGEPCSDPVEAPNLDAFRKQNLSMDRCISNYPLCSPYRGILMTGLWPYQNGITQNWIQLGTNFQSLGHTFANAGYRTAYVGKWHLSGPGHDRVFVPAGPHRQGFQDWHVWGAVDKHMSYSFTFNQDTGEKIQPEGYQTTLMTDQAVKIIHENHSDKPWMMIVSWHPPHFPVDDAPEADEQHFANKKVSLRPNIKTGPSMRSHVSSEEAIEKFHRGYYAHIRAVDREFGRLIKALDDTGQAENTIVVFTSDHGEMAGSHGRMYKQVPFEESARVPFAIRYPGMTPKGKRSDALFASIDIYPTLCGLAGIPIPPGIKGRDFSATLQGKSTAESEVVFLMNQVAPLEEQNPVNPDAPIKVDNSDANGGGYAPPDFRGLRSKTHTYAVASDGKWLLYDNTKDPYQQHNLIDDPSQRPLIEHFNGLIEAWLKEAGDPFELKEALRKRSSRPQ